MQVNRNMPNFKAAEIKPRKPEPKPNEGTKPTGRAGDTDVTKLPDGKVAALMDNAMGQAADITAMVGEHVGGSQEPDVQKVGRSSPYMMGKDGRVYCMVGDQYKVYVEFPDGSYTWMTADPNTVQIKSYYDLTDEELNTLHGFNGP